MPTFNKVTIEDPTPSSSVIRQTERDGSSYRDYHLIASPDPEDNDPDEHSIEIRSGGWHCQIDRDHWPKIRSEMNRIFKEMKQVLEPSVDDQPTASGGVKNPAARVRSIGFTETEGMGYHQMRQYFIDLYRASPDDEILSITVREGGVDFDTMHLRRRVLESLEDHPDVGAAP